MTTAIGLNPVKHAPTLAQEKPCYAELFERIVAIWNRVYAWICEWIVWLLPPPDHNLAKRSPDAFCHMVRYLEPEELARCERVAKSWKIPEKIWKARCAIYGVTSIPQSGSYKDIFAVPKMAFGPREWVKYGWGEPGPMPPLSEKVRSQIAERKNTHTLTLIPATINDQPLSLNSFAPLAEKSGMKLDISDCISKKYGSEFTGYSFWVWMQKEVEPGSRNKTQAQSEKDYPQKLGKPLWIMVSTVAHYARYKICLFPQTPQWTYTRTRDRGEDQYGAWFVVIGGSTPGVLAVSYSHDYAGDNIGVAFCHSI